MAGHLTVLEAAIGALPPAFRRKLMVTCDGAGASHGLITGLDKLAGRRGYQLTCSIGRELDKREHRAIATVPETAWQIAVDGADEVRERRAGCLHRYQGPAQGLLDRGGSRHRAYRPASRRPGRRPAGRLARLDARLRPA